jgi:hypothetical protein
MVAIEKMNKKEAAKKTANPLKLLRSRARLD